MHARYGHPSHQRLINSINNTYGCNLRSERRKRIKICTTCDLSKTTRARINKNMDGIPRDSNAYRVNTDLKKYPRSIRGFKYILVFIHEGSRYLTTYLMKKKSDTLKYLKIYKAFADAAIGGKFIELRGDNGGEYTGQRFQDYLKENGIAWRPSTPRTPEQNSISERTIRTLCTIIRSLLNHADMSHKYWCYACETATYLYNRLEHSALKGTTPYEKFIGKKPNISNLVTWGCIGVCHVLPDKRNNALSDTAKYVRMLGYHQRFKTYIVMTETGKILSRKISKWYEKVFKFPKRKNKEIKINSDDDGDKDLSSSSNAKHSSSKNHTTQESIAVSRPRRKRTFPTRMGQDLIFNEIKTLTNERDDILNDTDINAYLSSIKNIDDTTPKTYKEAITGDEKNHWIPSIADELNSLRETDTFELVKLPKGVNIVSSKWVFKKKTNSDDSIRYKSRLVARGFTQQFNKDYYFTYYPTLGMTSFRLILAFATKHGYTLRGIDIKTAYLYGKIDTDIFMQIPQGFEPTPSEQRIISLPGKTVWKLKRSLYGLKQSAYLWGKTFSKFLTSVGFKSLTADPCIYIHRERDLIIATYVDDCIILLKDIHNHLWLLKELKKNFKLNDLGPLKQCLNIEIKKTDNATSISQRKYIEKMFHNFNIHKYPKATTPRSTTAKLDFEESADYDPTFYRSMIGALIYIVIGTRPDIAEAVSKLASYSQSPKKVHKKAVHRVIQYLYNTRHYKIVYTNEENEKNLLHAYSDANLSNGKKHGYSRSGIITFYSGGPISWKSKLQTVVCESTRDSEYIAASLCSRDLIYAREFLQDLIGNLSNSKITLPASTLYCDNKPAINTIVRNGYTDKSKSIRLAYHKIRDLYQRAEIVPEHVGTDNNIADLLTKPLPAPKTAQHCSIIFNTTDTGNPQSLRTPHSTTFLGKNSY